MAITLKGASPELVGLEADKTDLTAEVNQIFHALDTNKYYYFTGETWEEVGGTE